jgi:hypothetical protein
MGNLCVDIEGCDMSELAGNMNVWFDFVMTTKRPVSIS